MTQAVERLSLLGSSCVGSLPLARGMLEMVDDHRSPTGEAMGEGIRLGLGLGGMREVVGRRGGIQDG